MTFDATDPGMLVNTLHPNGPLGPHIEVRAVTTTLDLPVTALAEAAIFGALARRGSPQLAGVLEREVLLDSLCNGLTRAAYHNGRFDQYLAVGEARVAFYGGRLFADKVAQAILFEAQALLTSMRGFVEEVMYVGARRLGDVPDDADRRVTSELRGGQTTLPEKGTLDARAAWFEELTAYRNALMHRGTVSQFGYVPVGLPVPQANDPKFNVMLMPDRTSIAKRNRPDSWTYDESRRLDVLVGGLWTELLAFARDIGAVWGLSIGCSSHRDAFARRRGCSRCGLKATTFARTVTSA